MLNRKLVRKGLLLFGLVSNAGLFAFAGIQYPADSLKPANKDSAMQWLTFNTEMLELSGTNGIAGINAPAIPMNKHSQKFVREYIATNSKTLDKIKEKSPSYFTIMDSVFSRYNLPLELKYLSVVESELKTNALSRVGARGAWQLMPTTARLLSLKVTARYDERTHLYKSTVAAAKYLDDLYDIFGDWLLVIAAYNSGPGPVFKAIKKSGSRNFWVMQQYLPTETRKHVKKFIGTHYYFEGEGSVTTLTKAEAADYSKRMNAFVAKHNILLQDKSDSAKEEQPQDEKEMKVVRTNAEMNITNERQAAKGIVE